MALLEIDYKAGTAQSNENREIRQDRWLQSEGWTQDIRREDYYHPEHHQHCRSLNISPLLIDPLGSLGPSGLEIFYDFLFSK